MKEYDNLWASLAVEKEEGPVTKFICLGLGIYTEEYKIYIPEERICKLKIQLNHALTRNKITLRELQSLAGSLVFCLKALPSERAFNRRFYGAMSGVSKPFHFIRVSRGMKEDIQVWLSFLDKCNGNNIFPDHIWVTNEGWLLLLTDSSGSLGCGAFFQNKWIVLQ